MKRAVSPASAASSRRERPGGAVVVVEHLRAQVDRAPLGRVDAQQRQRRQHRRAAQAALLVLGAESGDGVQQREAREGGGDRPAHARVQHQVDEVVAAGRAREQQAHPGGQQHDDGGEQHGAAGALHATAAQHDQGQHDRRQGEQVEERRLHDQRRQAHAQHRQDGRRQAEAARQHHPGRGRERPGGDQREQVGHRSLLFAGVHLREPEPVGGERRDEDADQDRHAEQRRGGGCRPAQRLGGSRRHERRGDLQGHHRAGEAEQQHDGQVGAQQPPDGQRQRQRGCRRRRGPQVLGLRPNGRKPPAQPCGDLHRPNPPRSCPCLATASPARRGCAPC